MFKKISLINIMEHLNMILNDEYMKFASFVIVFFLISLIIIFLMDTNEDYDYYYK